MYPCIPYQPLAHAIVLGCCVLSLLQSLRSNPTSAFKDVLVVLFLKLTDVFNEVGWLKAFRTLFPSALLAAVIIVSSWALMVAYVHRKLVLWCQEHPEQEKCLLGRPLLFPAQLTHARMFPERYHYGIKYFLVGVPVGLRGHVGALMSIDSDGSTWHATSNYIQSYIGKLLRKFFWFTIDTRYYLHRGDGQMSLTQKLELFLKEQGEDMTRYPYAYLITIPQFFWWTKSPISYWYLYSPSKELSAIIMEINNSYGEKKNAFCRLIREENSCFEKRKCSQTLSIVSARGSQGVQEVRFMSSAPVAKYYKGSWEKDIFASPFEKVEGWFNLRFMDPLDPSPAKGGPLHSNMTLMSTTGKSKVSSRLFSRDVPLDPLSVSSWELAIFLMSWSFVIPASIGRIVVEALRIRFRGNMPYLNKPDVKKNNIPRNASKPEKVMEKFFRMYLVSMAAQCQFPLEVVYTPAKSLHLHPITIRSPVKTVTSAPCPSLMIQPLTPKFYTNISKYSDAQSGFMAETRIIPQFSDPVSQRLWVSDPELFKQWIGSTSPPSDPEKRRTPFISLLSLQYEQGAKSFMDQFIECRCSSDFRWIYIGARMNCYLTEKFAWGSYRVAATYWFILRALIMHLTWKGLWRIQCHRGIGKSADILMVSGIFVLLIRAWRGLTSSFSGKPGWSPESE